MPHYDGEIRVNTKIETAEAQQKLLNLQNHMNKTALKVEDITKKMGKLKDAKVEDTAEWKKLRKDIDSTKGQIQSLTAKAREMRNIEVPTGEYLDLQYQLKEAQKECDTLYAKADKMRAEGKATEKAWEVLKERFSTAEARAGEVYHQMVELKKAGNAFTNQAGTDEYKKVKADLQAAYEEMRRLKVEEKELEAAFNTDKTAGIDQMTGDLKVLQGDIALTKLKMQEVINKEAGMKNGMENVGDSVRGVANKVKKLSAETSNTHKGFSNLVRTMKSMVLSMAVFQVMSKGMEFLEAELQNLAKYSYEYNKSVSSLKSANAELKNSLASAFAPIVQMAIPYLVKLIGWLNTAANTIAKFFAALQGKSTYAKATKQNIDYAASMSDIADSAKKAVGSLAAFDELNVMQKNDASGGGNGNGGEATGENAFEEADIDKKTLKWVEWLKTHLDDILTAVGMIGAGLLAWKIASRFTDDLSTLAGVAVAAAGAFLLAKSAFDAWKNGVDWENLAGMLAGIALIVGGLGLAFGTLGAAIGAIIGGLVLLAVSIKDIKENGLDWPNLIGFITGATLVVMGLTTAIGPLAGAIAGVVGGLAMLVIGIQDVMQNGVTLKNGIMIVAGVFLALFTTVGAVAAGIAALIAALVLAVVSDWGNFKQTVLEPLKKWGQELWDDFTRIGRGFIDIMDGINEFVAGVFTLDWKRAWGGIQKISSGIWDVIVGTLKASVNLLIGILNTMYNAVVGVVNAVIAAINRIDITIPDWVPGLGGKGFKPNIQTITPVNIPYLANGGVTTGSTLAMIGEAGKEAVIPLERNTEWMNTFAETLAGKINGSGEQFVNLTVELDGNTVYKRIVQLDREFAGRTGSSGFAY